MLLTEAAAPGQRVVVVEPEIVFHPDDPKPEPGETGIKPAKVILKRGIGKGRTGPGCLAGGRDHGNEMTAFWECAAAIAMQGGHPGIQTDRNPGLIEELFHGPDSLKPAGFNCPGKQAVIPVLSGNKERHFLDCMGSAETDQVVCVPGKS